MNSNSLYSNKLDELIRTPGSFSGTPGYQFARDEALQAAERGMSSQRGSGNILAELMNRGNNLANSNYTDYAKLLGGLSGQEQQYDIGLQGQANTADRNFNDFTLGKWGAGNTAQRDFWNYDLGREQNANTAANNQNSFSIATGGNRPGSVAASRPVGGSTAAWPVTNWGY